MSAEAIDPNTGEVVATPPEPAPLAAARPRSANVRKALLQAQRTVRGVAKADTAKVFKDGKEIYSYKFASSEDMVEACREALLEAGLVWELVGWDLVEPAARTNDARDRRASVLPTLVGHFELSHPESGDVELRDYPMPIASRNDADKAVAGAITYLIGQSLRGLLMVPRVSEEDAKNDPDFRTEKARGWHDDEPRGTRREILSPERPTPAPKGDDEPAGETTEWLKGECQRLVGELQKRTRGTSPQIFRAEAGVPQSGQLSAAELREYRGFLDRKLAQIKAGERERNGGIEGDDMPGWMEPGKPGTLSDGLDQRPESERQTTMPPDPTDKPPSERFQYPQRDKSSRGNGRATR
jgi:hypothetical protein